MVIVVVCVSYFVHQQKNKHEINRKKNTISLYMSFNSNSKLMLSTDNLKCANEWVCVLIPEIERVREFRGRPFDLARQIY